MEDTRSAAREKFAELRKVGKDKRAERRALLKRIEELDSEIERNRLECLAARNDYAQIHILPVEVLSTIFQQACHCEERMEIKLSRVCRLWRSITLSSPNLWSTFTYCDSLSEVKRLLIYLERSRNHPVDLLFYIHNGGRFAVVKQLLDKAIKHVSRWRRFSLVVHEDSWSSRDLFAPLLDVSAPHLHRFEVSTPANFWYHDKQLEYDDDSTHHFRYIFKGGAPLLSDVKLDSISWEGFMPLSNMTTLEIQVTDPDACSSPFRYLLHLFDLPLVNLSLIGEVFEAAKASTQQVTTTTLKIFRCSNEIVESILEHIHAPQLEVLILKGCCPDLSGNPYHNSCPTIFPSLHTLSLVDCQFFEFENFSHFALATNCITRLYMFFHVSHLYRHKDVLYLMPKNSPQTILWPRLNSLTYLIGPGAEEDMDDEDFKPYLEVFECRSRILNTHCTLELQPRDAEFWKTKHPASWNRLQKGGFYREMQPRDGCYLPFPPTKFDEFHRGSKDPFMMPEEYYV
ncbi:hypothetical protein GALMADRAFT_240520 [Galerina marginata CBS 339.88]|uniref:F-box domain-containing protein n=1 Tax=Galerina marginata (strain CBS 339.88) TaxID=685588 RepID=A0A067TSW7_GALM3|nr:hypothetical protein GALMADRAFT_240520 [Galerina marginata CBS 339.88]